MKKLSSTWIVLPVALVLVGMTVAFGAWYFRAKTPEPAGGTAMLWPATERMVRTLDAQVRKDGDDANAHRQLGYAYLQKARETGDGAYNDQAAQAFRRTLELAPNDAEAMNGLGLVHLTLHQFPEALAWAERSLQVKPNTAFTYGIVVDAYLEMGRYDEAVQAAQKMVDTRPDLSSYSRVSYVRELMGDIEGAVDAMRMAVSAGSGHLEHTSWARIQLGHLFFHQGDLASAEQEYRIALDQIPYYGHGYAGLARIRAAQGQHDEAVALYQQAVELYPIPEYVGALAEAYEAAGRTEEAAAQYAEALAMVREEKEGGMDVDEEIAHLILASSGSTGEAVSLARAAYDRRPTLKNADILAWALYHAGDYEAAAEASREALRFETQNADLYYHAGMIARARGQHEEAARHFEQALSINPYFSSLDADSARAYLARAGG